MGYPTRDNERGTVRSSRRLLQADVEISFEKYSFSLSFIHKTTVSLVSEEREGKKRETEGSNGCECVEESR